MGNHDICTLFAVSVTALQWLTDWAAPSLSFTVKWRQFLAIFTILVDPPLCTVISGNPKQWHSWLMPLNITDRSFAYSLSTYLWHGVDVIFVAVSPYQIRLTFNWLRETHCQTSVTLDHVNSKMGHNINTTAVRIRGGAISILQTKFLIHLVILLE